MLDPDAVAVEFTISGTAGVSETPVGVLVPVLRAVDVRLGAIRPEDGTDVLVASAWRERLQKTKQTRLDERY